MPQKTNLNVSPYFDDFNVDKNFYKVLFKPGYPVQARELTTLQSILQNQIESFGNHIFKEGSMVIPGAITYDDKYFSVKINPENTNVLVTSYLDELVGKKIKGQSSGVTATVQNYSVPPDDGVEDITLYVKYGQSANSLEISKFQNAESLLLEENLTYGNTTIAAGDIIASLVQDNATAVGSAVNITKGIYFLRGAFVQVNDSVIVLDPYSNNVSYRVGLLVNEEIITSNDDSSLNDNSRGFSNFAAPGSDRLKISAVLSKKELTDFSDINFSEIIRIQNGKIKKLQDTSAYSIIRDYFAKRTYEESGDYSLSQFKVDLQNSLDDGISNNGIFPANRQTEQGNTPSDDLVCVKVSPGKAYVRGYDIDLPSSSILDVPKPRQTENSPVIQVPFEMGNRIRVNRVQGSPIIDLKNSSNIIDLKNRFVNETGISTIGKARVYAFNVTDNSYSDNTTEWDLYLFDVQTYTILTVNENLNVSNCPVSSYVRGLSSGASGYVAETVSGSKDIKLIQTSGSFMIGEEIVINEDRSFNRSVKSIKSYSTEDIKSVQQNTVSLGGSSTFYANTVLTKITPKNFTALDKVVVSSGGTVTIPSRVGQNFLGIRSDAIIRYQNSGQQNEIYNRVSAVSSDGLTIQLAQLNSIVGIFSGSFPSTNIETTFSLGVPDISDTDKASLYIKLSNDNISNVDLSDTDLVVTKQFTGRTTNSSGTMIVNIFDSGDAGISTAFFEPFDTERYTITYSDGTIENLTGDQASIENGGSQIVFTGLRISESNIVVNAVIRKSQIKSKTKVFVRSEKLTINKTNVGSASSITGLSTSQYYGLRVEDPEISLNVPDVVNIVAIYESLNSEDPVLDSLTFGAGYSLNTASVLGEKIIGQTSGAIAQLVTRVNASKVEFVYLNSKSFEVAEEVLFEESNIRIAIQQIGRGVYQNVTNRFVLDKNQKNQYYDYSKIVRPLTTASPSRKLLVIFNYYDILTNDTGDIITVNSYTKERFTKDIPVLPSGERSSDTLDFRPRVSKFSSSTASPFDFSSKVFQTVTSGSVTPNESSTISYSYYLPRIDKVYLNKFGEFSVIQGSPSLNPKEPLNNEEAMEIATVTYPAYLYDPKDVSISLVDNKRYTMRDIGKLEDRIETLEYTTSLSLLELDTKTLQIQDADGFSRFKTGFFVDDFKNNDLIERDNPDVRCDVNIEAGELVPPVDFISIKAELALDPSVSALTADFSKNLPLLDPNVQKTGDLVTLKYQEVEWLRQPFASDYENVNPFNVVTYEGEMRLTPLSDNWVSNVYIENTSEFVVIKGRRFKRWRWVRRLRTGWWWGWPWYNREWWNKREWKKGKFVSLGFDYVTNITTESEPDPYMRSRNVQFVCDGLKPFTRHYGFLDGNGSIDVIPKLIEISMVSGTFEVGETVSILKGENVLGSFRVAKPNHKFGDFQNPDISYEINPYLRTTAIPSTYSPSSTLLNIDTFSLSEEVLSTWNGYIEKDAEIVGESSQAIAKVSDVKLVSDQYGDLIGCFFIRDPNTNPTPPVRIATGERTFKITSDLSNAATTTRTIDEFSEASAVYSGNGITNTTTTERVQVRIIPRRRVKVRKRDPLAQTFTVDETGAFLTSVDAYFYSKDTTQNLFVELRTVELGLPTDQLVQDYARVTLTPRQIKTSFDASVPTRITFPSPIHLEPDTEYALVFLCPTSDKYNMWVATMKKKTIETQSLPDAQSIYITRQYLGGSLYKSQNGTIWTPSQEQDLKFTLYKAKFAVNRGDVIFYNPSITNGGGSAVNIPAPVIGPGALPPNPIEPLPRKIKVGITTTTDTQTINEVFAVGKKIKWKNAYGYIERIGGPIKGAVTVVNTGIGYSTSGVFYNVPLYSITGKGSGAVGIVTVSADGKIESVSIPTITRGSGYAVGDILGITTSTLSKGKGATISIGEIAGVDTLLLTNVQGEKFVSIYDGGSSDLLYYYNNSGQAVSLGSTRVEVTSQVLSPLYTGDVLRVYHYNHGHHGKGHKVKLANIAPNTIPVIINGTIGINDTVISIGNTSEFATFENKSSTSGYVVINNEVMRYSGIGNGTLIIAERGVNNSPIRVHSLGSFAKKYEIKGFSLTKVNKTHSVVTNEIQVEDYNEVDRYYLRVPREEGREDGEDQQNFVEGGACGGVPGIENPIASQNHQFNSIIPQFNIVTPGKTTVTSQIRTISGTSAGGLESSYIDQGYQSVELNKVNFFNSPRLVASSVNESEYLDNLPNNKSLSFQIRMFSEDENLSPVLDLQTGLFVLGRNKINNPIKDYASDDRVNFVEGDPHSAIYISKRIDLQKSATSLKVYVSAYRPPGTDFRVLYQLFRPDSSEVEQSFTLFPGYDNLVNRGISFDIIDPSLNSGRADQYVRPSKENEFLEYQFTADNLDKFTGFSIKIVMSSMNEAYPVKFRDLRCIALA